MASRCGKLWFAPNRIDKISTPVLEVHGLAKTELVPSDRIEVEWMRFIRAEQKFESLEALRAQIESDREVAVGLAADG